jgi:16S rRNA (cytosine967-C5)-methyltransferase
LSKPRPATARSLAARFLEAVLRRGKTPELLGQEADFLALSPGDRGLCHELVLGALRHLALLDAVLGRFCRRPLRHLEPRLQQILRVATYQLLRLERVPGYAAVNEAVAEARAAGFARQAGFVNAVLRQVAAVGDPALFLKLDPGSAEGLATLHSHPPFLVERWLERFPAAAVRAWLERSGRSPVHFLTVNTRRISLEEFLAACWERGIEAVPARPGLPVAEVPGSLLPLEPLLAGGLAFPQDLWSHAVTALVPGAGYRRILDLCAAPGGKAFALALRFPEAELCALDVNPARLRIVAERAAGLGLDRIALVAGDAADPPLPAAGWDLVLVDAPCSGTGTLQRNPDLRWRLAPEEFLRQAHRQRRILAAAAERVAPGGRLVYSTCSAEPEENQAVVEGFLAGPAGAGFAVEPVDDRWADFRTPEGFFQTFPAAGRGEGFFAALLHRTDPCTRSAKPAR